MPAVDDDDMDASANDSRSPIIRPSAQVRIVAPSPAKRLSKTEAALKKEEERRRSKALEADKEEEDGKVANGAYNIPEGDFGQMYP